jgi:hypothetical protein
VCSDEIGLSIEVVSTSFVVLFDISEFDLVSQESSDSSESLDELEALLRLVSDEFNFSSVVGVVVAEPLSQRVFGNYVQVQTSL